MSAIESLLHAIIQAEDMLGRSLPYGPYTGHAFEALEELQELRAAEADRPQWERMRAVGDALADAAENLENNAEASNLWTELYMRREEWRNLPDAIPTQTSVDPPF